MPPKKTSVAADPTEVSVPAPPPPPPTPTAIAAAISSAYSGSVRLPEFFRDDPAAWFGSLESVLYIKQVTDPVAKFHFAIQRLDAETTTCVRTLLRDPPTPSSYAQLRKKLCAFYERSPEDRLDQLLSTSTSGNVKPSRFAEELLRLGDNLTMDDVYKCIFLRSLPKNIANAVASVKSKTFADVADAADVVYANLDAASRRHDPPSFPVNAVVQRSVNRANDSTAPRPGPKLCWYHRRWGDAAKSCQPPCSKASAPKTRVFHVEADTNQENS